MCMYEYVQIYIHVHTELYARNYACISLLFMHNSFVYGYMFVLRFTKMLLYEMCIVYKK